MDYPESSLREVTHFIDSPVIQTIAVANQKLQISRLLIRKRN